MNKPKIAANHLEPCEEIRCRFNHDKVIHDDMIQKSVVLDSGTKDVRITIPSWNAVSKFMLRSK